MNQVAKWTIPLSVIFLLSALLTACAPTLPLTAYVHSEPPFMVKYPKAWVDLPLKPDEVLSVARGLTGKKRLPALSVSVTHVPKGFDLECIPDETVRRIKEIMVKINPKTERYRIVSTQFTTLNNGARALEATYSWGWRGPVWIPFFASQVSTIKDNKLIIAFAVGTPFFGPLHDLKRFARSLTLDTMKISMASHNAKKGAGEKDSHASDIITDPSFLGMTSDDVGDFETVAIDAQKKLEAEILDSNGEVKKKWSLFKKTTNRIVISEMIEDVETLEMYEPESASGFPDTGFIIQNDADRAVVMKIEGKINKTLVVSPGNLSIEALPVGKYSYSFYTAEDGLLESLSGKRTVRHKLRYLFKLYTN